MYVCMQLYSDKTVHSVRYVRGIVRTCYVLFSCPASWAATRPLEDLCNAIQCNAMHCDAIQCNAIHSNAMQYNATQCNTTQQNTMQCNATQYNAIQYNDIQRNTMQCNAMQCNTIQLYCLCVQKFAFLACHLHQAFNTFYNKFTSLESGYYYARRMYYLWWSLCTLHKFYTRAT